MARSLSPNYSGRTCLALFCGWSSFGGIVIHAFCPIAGGSIIIDRPLAFTRDKHRIPLHLASQQSHEQELQPPREESRTDRFHNDMKRVLETRASHDYQTQTKCGGNQDSRRHRPSVLDHDVDGAERVLTMLHRMIQMGLATEETFQIAMRAFLQRGRLRWVKKEDPLHSGGDQPPPITRGGRLGGEVICAADQLEELLQTCQQLLDKSRLSLDTYQLVLQAYATCSTPRGDRQYAQRADDLLQEMIEDGVFDDDSELLLGSLSLNDGQEEELMSSVPLETLAHVVHAWAWQQANRQPGNCAERAHYYLEFMERQYRNNLGTATTESVNETDRLMLDCYDWVLEAWSKSGSTGSAQKANAKFARMKDFVATVNTNSQSDSGDGLVLTSQSYTNAILAWSKCDEPGAAQHAQDLLEECVDHFVASCSSDDASNPIRLVMKGEPELIAWNGVITAWARRGDPAKAEAMLWKMNHLLQSHRDRLQMPNIVTYNSVLHAHVKSRDKQHALERSLALVEYMEEQSSEQPDIKPDDFTYNTLMKAWIQSGRPDMAEQAERILMKLERLGEMQMKDKGNDNSQPQFPTNRHFNVVINAYAKSSNPFAAQKAYKLLERMKALKSEASKPDIISYTSVIECFSKSSEPNASRVVLGLLDEAFRVHNETGDPNMRPNLRTFTNVIWTLANCQGSVVEARKLLTQLVDLYEETQDKSLRPNAYPYNYVLNCAANTVLEDKLDSFRIATQTFREMQKSLYARPDCFTYAFWFKCCNNLLPPDSELKSKCMFYALDQCKKDGLLSNYVLNRLQRGASPSNLEEWLDLPPRDYTKFRNLRTKDLPPVWSRNV